VRRILASSLLAAFLSGCCVVEKTADIAVDTAGKATSIALDAAFSSPSPPKPNDDDTSPSKVAKRVTR
jgi:hypothetical protein